MPPRQTLKEGEYERARIDPPPKKAALDTQAPMKLEANAAPPSRILPPSEVRIS